MLDKAANDLTLAIPLPHFRAHPSLASIVTEPHPLVTALEGLIAKLRWHMDALREWIKRLNMGMREHRIDPDYDPSENDVRLLRRAVEQLLLSRPGSNYNNGGGGEKRTLNLLLGMVATLAVSAIVGGIAFYGKFTALEERVSGMMATHEARLTRLENINERRYREAP